MLGIARTGPVLHAGHSTPQRGVLLRESRRLHPCRVPLAPRLFEFPLERAVRLDDACGLVCRLANLGEFLPLLAVGFVTAAIVGWFAIQWLIAYLSKRSLYVFAIYCAIVGTITLIFS